jgi:hypothetical protein
MGGLRDSNQRLARDASRPRAVSTDPIALGEQHPRTQVRSEPGANQATRAGADDREVIFWARH